MSKRVSPKRRGLRKGGKVKKSGTYEGGPLSPLSPDWTGKKAFPLGAKGGGGRTGLFPSSMNCIDNDRG